MQRIALLIVLIGIIFLASYIEISSPLRVNSDKEIKNLLENQKVFVSGQVIKESQTSFSRKIVLDNNITIDCDCLSIPKLINKKILVLGIVDTYQNSKIKVLKIKWS